MEEKKVKNEEADAKEKTTTENKESDVKEKNVAENKDSKVKEEKTNIENEDKKVKVTTEDKEIKGKVTIEDPKCKKNIMLAYTIVGIVLVILIAALLYVMSYMKTPYYAVKKSFNALKKGDIASVNENISYDELMNALLEKTDTRQKMSNLDKSCFEKFEYNIDNTVTDGDTAVVTISTKNKNFRNALTKWSQNIYQKFISGEEISNEQGEVVLIDCLGDESIGTMSVTEDIILNKVDGTWRIQVDDKLKNAIFPGLNEIGNSIESIIND